MSITRESVSTDADLVQQRGRPGVSKADIDHLAAGLTHTDFTRVDLTRADQVLKIGRQSLGRRLYQGFAVLHPAAALATGTRPRWCVVVPSVRICVRRILAPMPRPDRGIGAMSSSNG